MPLAVSSRGLGRSPLKAQTRVRIPLPLCRGPFVYRLGRHPFTVQRGVRFPYGLLWGRGFGGNAGWIVERRHRAEAIPVRNPILRRTGSRSSVWLEHSTVTREVAGSSPVGSVFHND